MSKYLVCPACDGEGYVSNLGEMTSAHMDEWYGDDWSARDDFVRDYTTRGGPYDRACDLCNGQRVVTPTQVEEYDERLAYEAERRAEMTSAERWG